MSADVESAQLMPADEETGHGCSGMGDGGAHQCESLECRQLCEEVIGGVMAEERASSHRESLQTGDSLQKRAASRQRLNGLSILPEALQSLEREGRCGQSIEDGDSEDRVRSDVQVCEVGELADAVDLLLREVGRSVERSPTNLEPFEVRGEGGAATVHKVQGLTLDRAVIDLSTPFTPALAYVALSRVPTMDGILLSGLGKRGLISWADVTVKMEYERLRKAADARRRQRERESGQ
jgi:hypothetical protein